MPKLFALLLATCLITSASAEEMKLICEETSEFVKDFRKNAPSLGVDIYSVDLSSSAVRQLSGELKEMRIISVEIKEEEIRILQSGYINKPESTENFITVISRVSGRWARHANYLNAGGIWVSGPELEKLARSLGLWGPFGIRQVWQEGECKLNSHKF